MVSRPNARFPAVRDSLTATGIAGPSLPSYRGLIDAYAELCAGLLAAAVIARISDQSNFYHWWH